MTRRTHGRRQDPARWFPLIGIAAALVLAIGVYLSWQATNGVPGKPTYDVHVQIRNANRLIANNEVRIAGVRVGRVGDVRAVPPPAGDATDTPYADITLKLETRLKPLSTTTRVKIRPASVLGATYVDLVPGNGGSPLPAGGTLPLERSTETVELTDLLDVFDVSTSRNLQRSVTSLAGGLAGRGADAGETISALSRLANPLSDVTANLAAPGTRLRELIGGYRQTLDAVEPVADDLGSMMNGGARTFGALGEAREELGDTIDVFPPTARAATGALARLQPALAGLAELSEDLRPAADKIPTSVTNVNAALDAGVLPFERTPRFAAQLSTTLTSLRKLTRRPQTRGSLRKAEELFAAAGTLFERLTPAQVQCNILSLVGEGWASAFSFGQGQGPSMALLGLTALGSNPLGTLQNKEQLPNYHVNYLPHSNYDECESGNEPFDDSRRSTSNPPGLQGKDVPKTFPPTGVPQLAKNAGLLDTPPGATP